MTNTPAAEAPAETLSIELPVNSWVLLLAALEQHNEQATEVITTMREAGDVDVHKLPPEQVFALTGGFTTRATIVDAMAKAGHMTPAAQERYGSPLIGRVLKVN